MPRTFTQILPFPRGPQMFALVPTLPQELHQLFFFIQHAEEREALLALSFVEVLHESRGPYFAEFPARLRVRRTSQNCQDFSAQTAASFLARHLRPRRLSHAKSTCLVPRRLCEQFQECADILHLRVPPGRCIRFAGRRKYSLSPEATPHSWSHRPSPPLQRSQKY